MSTFRVEIVVDDDSEDLIAQRADHRLAGVVAETIIGADWTGAELSLIHLAVTGEAGVRVSRFVLGEENGS